MEVFENFATGSGLVSEECFKTLFKQYDFSDTNCIKNIISKGLGYGIIAGSLLVKVPQVVKITSAKSGKGLSLTAIFMEIFCITATLAYSFRNGFPFSAWGESLFLGLQTAIVGSLVLYYQDGAQGPKKGNASSALAFLAVYSVAVAILLGPIAPTEALWTMQAANVPLIMISKLIQAKSNFVAKSTGQLSAVTVFMLFFGAIARVFTSIQETGDRTTVIMYCTSVVANGIIAAQVILYWNANITKTGKRKQKSKKA